MKTLESTSFQNEFHELTRLAHEGKISQLSKAELEHFAALLCRTEATPHRRSNDFSDISETVRTLLIVRMSEEANKEATRISKIALLIAMAALGCTVLQVFAVLWPKA